MTEPSVTIVIPALNEEKFLPKLLESLVLQTDHEFKVIVVDGRSRDRTVQSARQFNDRLNLEIIESPRASLPLQRNLGGRDAKTDWIVFSDADNVFLPYAIGRMKEFMKSRSVSLFTTWCSADSEIPGEVLLTVIANLIIEGSVSVKRPFSPGPLTAIRKNVFAKVNGYNEDASWGEDLEFSIRVCRDGVNFRILRETLYIWSMRRFRKEGKMKVLQQFARGILYTLITHRALTNMPGYMMGGHLYSGKKQPIKRSVLKDFEIKLKALAKELF